MADKAPYICDPTDASAGRAASFIFLHGYGDDAEGLPLGLAQQFQFNSKLPHLRWVLPNAAHNPDAMGRAWYVPKALAGAGGKPRVPGQDDDDDDAESKGDDGDDEAGIMASVDVVDELVRKEVERGVARERIVVGGFSQGCAISLVWGLVGRERDGVGGVVALSGYLPLVRRVGGLKRERGVEGNKKGSGKKWFYVHGSKDMLVPLRLFVKGKEELNALLEEGDTVEEHVYEGMSHTTANAELRDLLRWLEKVVPS